VRQVRTDLVHSHGLRSKKNSGRGRDFFLDFCFYRTYRDLAQSPGSDNLYRVINSDLRVKAASLIRSYLAGKINNHEFADGFPHDKGDPALHAIEQRLWFHFDDVRTHYCEFQPHSGVEILFRRCALFLDTHLDYEWPDLSHHNLAHPIVRVLTGQLFRSKAIQKAKSAGDYGIWPFLRNSDFEEAKAKFSANEVTSDAKLPEVPLTRTDRLWKSFWMTIQGLQTTFFFGALVCFLWGVLGHPSWLAASLVCLILYLILFGIVRLASRRKLIARRSDTPD
jgi:hypothetical protein